MKGVLWFKAFGKFVYSFFTRRKSDNSIYQINIFLYPWPPRQRCTLNRYQRVPGGRCTDLQIDPVPADDFDPRTLYRPRYVCSHLQSFGPKNSIGLYPPRKWCPLIRSRIVRLQTKKLYCLPEYWQPLHGLVSRYHRLCLPWDIDRRWSLLPPLPEPLSSSVVMPTWLRPRRELLMLLTSWWL